MTIQKDKNDSILTVKISGRLDSTTSTELDAALDAEYEGLTGLVLDFECLEYISSAGLRVLLKAQKTMNLQGSMTIKNVNDTIMEVFSITGFDNVLTIEK